MIKMHISYSTSSKIYGNPRNIVILRHNDTAVTEVIDSKEEKRRRRRAGWAYIVGLFAVVFMWRAIWDWSEMYFSSTGSFIVGLILVGVVGFLQRDHVKDLFG
jgi:hypothetical protein